MSVSVVAHPQHAGLVKKRTFDAHKEFLPYRQRPRRPARIKFIRPIAHADDACLAPGTGTAVGRAIGIQQGDARPAPQQILHSPRPEDPRANHRKIVCLSRHKSFWKSKKTETQRRRMVLIASLALLFLLETQGRNIDGPPWLKAPMNHRSTRNPFIFFLRVSVTPWCKGFVFWFWF